MHRTTSGDAMSLRPFHLAFPVDDLEAARVFYRDTLGAGVGRESERWIDFDLHGHQVVAHLVEEHRPASTNAVDGHAVPAFHFGVVLTMEDWRALAERLRRQEVEFLVEPYTRFEGEVGEQATLFVRDPAGNALEFKAFADLGQLFAK